METGLQIICVILAAAALVPALAHALEAPGKYRLNEESYFTVQGIYYPGFTLTGFAEPVAALATLGLLFVTPPGTVSFWLTLVAAIALAGVHGVYWLVTHPVNRVWMRRQNPGGAGARFFRGPEGGGEDAQSFTRLRDRWERSHVVRAALAATAFVALVIVLSPAA